MLSKISVQTTIRLFAAALTLIAVALGLFVRSAIERDNYNKAQQESICDGFVALVYGVEDAISSIFTSENPTPEELAEIKAARQAYYDRTLPAIDECNNR